MCILNSCIKNIYKCHLSVISISVNLFVLLFSIHWIPVEWHGFENMEGARRSISADMWAVGTTLWEIFSYGESPVPVYANSPYENLMNVCMHACLLLIIIVYI